MGAMEIQPFYICAKTASVNCCVCGVCVGGSNHSGVLSSHETLDFSFILLRSGSCWQVSEYIWSWTKQWLYCIKFLGWHHPHRKEVFVFLWGFMCFFSEYISCCCLCFRSRLADFQQNCQPSPKSASGCVRESRAMCLKAYSGLIGETK